MAFYNGFIQPGCQFDSFTGQHQNAACTYDPQIPNQYSYQNDCMSGYYAIQDSDSQVPKKYCLSSCKKQYGLTPDTATRTCTTMFGINSCMQGQYRSNDGNCANCDQRCLQCEMSGLCLSCINGYYLDVGSSLCEPKQTTVPATLRVFVAVGTYTGTPNQADGTANNPFYDIRDALIFINQSTAQYTTREVVMYLQKGTHYITLRAENQGYQIANTADYSQNEYSLSITPLFCSDTNAGVTAPNRCYQDGQQVTVKNKIGSYFTIDVPLSLSITNVIFDAIDSMGNFSDGCLGAASDTCSFDSNNNDVLSVIGTCCSKPSMHLDTCNFVHPTSLIRIKYTKANQLDSAKELALLNTEFRHFFYPMNSLIEYPPEGASITITNAIFEYFSICGSIISNQHRIPYDSGTRSFGGGGQGGGGTQDTFSTQVASFEYRHAYPHSIQEMQFSVNDTSAYFNPFKNTSPCSDKQGSSTCNSITITSSTFQYFDIFFSSDPVPQNLIKANTQQRPNLQYKTWTPDGEQQMYDEYRAPLFLLQTYSGGVSITSTTFKEIRYPARTCYEHSYESNIEVNQVSPMVLYTAIKGIKTQMPIVITNTAGLIVFAKNTVTYSSGSKGFLLIERGRLATHPVVIYDNTFAYVSGFIYSGILNLRTNYTAGYRVTTTDYCAGFLVASNSFQNSAVCSVPSDNSYYKSAGLVKVSCMVDETNLLTDQIYKDPNSWWLMSQALTLTPTYTTVTIGSTALQVDTKVTTIKDNSFLNNLRGYRGSMILSLEVPYISMSGNTFRQIGDVVLQTLVSYNVTNSYGGFLGSYPIFESNSFGGSQNTNGLIQILGGFGFSVSGDTIGQGNWKQDASNSVYASYLYSKKVRGQMKIQGLTVTTPPLSACSSAGEALTSDINQFNLMCGGSSPYPSQTREPLIKLESFNDQGFYAPHGVDYQTIFEFKDLHISNLKNSHNSQAFIQLQESTSLKKIKILMSNVTLNSLSQTTSAICDLRGYESQISSFTLIDGGSSTSKPEYIFKLGDSTGQSSSTTTTLSQITLTRVSVSKALIEIPTASGSAVQTISIGQTTITDCEVQQNVLLAKNTNADVTLDTWTVSNTKINQVSDVNDYEFGVTMSQSFVMNNITHSCDIARSHCKVLRFYQASKSITLTNSDFSMVANSANYQIDTNSKLPPFMITADTLTMSNNSFSGFKELNTQGGVFKTLVATLTDENSNYYENSGTTGGVFYIEGAGTAQMTTCNFYQNTATNAGVIQLAETVKLTASGCNFYQNSASSSGGVLRTQQGATFDISTSSFYSNTAGTDSSVIYSFSNEAGTRNSRIKDSFIYKNRMPNGKNTIVVLYSVLEFDNVEFYQNLALEGSHGIYTAYSTLSIKNSRCYTKDKDTFDFHFLPSETSSSVDSTSVCLTASQDATVAIKNSTFENTRDLTGALSIMGIVYISIQDSTFKDNEANIGSSIYVSNFYQLTITNCTFTGNVAWSSGSDIYVQNASRSMTVTQSTFTSPTVNSIYVANAKLNLQHNTFSAQAYQEFFNDDQQYTVICDNCGELNVVSNTFSSLDVDGVIGAKNTSLRFTWDQLSSTKAYIEGNTLQNIQYHTDGGGIKLLNFDAALIKNNIFRNIRQHSTTVELKGAAFHQSGSYSINARLVQNTFDSNQAAVGGAVAYQFYRPQIDDSNTFTSNVADKYGTNIAGYATKLAFISEETARALVNYDFSLSYTAYAVSSVSLYSDFKITTHQSGGIAPNFYIAILDRFGQVVKTKNDDKLTVSLKVISASNYAPIATSSVDIRSNNGIFNVTGLTLIAEPDTTVTIQVSADTVFTSTNPDVLQFKASNGGNLLLSTTVQFRACIEGEAFLDNGECSPCTSGTTYLLTIPSSPTNCLNCPNNANCFGGSEIGPKAGYWRSSSTSVNFMTCFLGAACQGRQTVGDSPLGNCADGYRGMFCAQCIQGYTRSSTFKCAKCPEQWKNILLLVGVFLIALILIVLLVKSTLNAVHSQKSPFAIYIKVMINHLQLIFLTSSFDLSWPDQVNSFYAQTQPVANVSDKVVSLDCFLDGTTSTVIGRFYLYLLTYLLIPFIVTSASLCFWWLKIQKNKKRICSRSIATIIILLFLLHPTITNTMFQTFLCRDVDGTLRLVQQLDETCWQGKHFWWALLGGFPGLICWALGIPAFAWLVLRQHKMRLHNLEVKEKYGFLYKGYKVDSYYWECVIMYRKVAMIFISVFLNGIGTMIQALVVMVLLVFFIVVTQRYKPYYSRQLNDLEIVSLITSCITFYCGLFFLSSKSPSDPSYEANRDFYLSTQAKWVFFFVIVLSNLLFLLMWIFKFLGEVRDMFRKKCTGLYVCLCLCCRRGLLKEDIRNARQNAVREIVIETIEKLERYFRRLRHMYIGKRNFVDKNKFQKMVHHVHHQFEKLNTNKVLLDEEGEQPAFKGNIRMHAAFDDQYSRANDVLKQQVDNQEMGKITFSVNDKDASIFVIEEEDISGEKEPQKVGKGKALKRNIDLHQPEGIDHLNMCSPESETPSMDHLRNSDRRKQALMTDSRMTFQNSSDFDEASNLKQFQKQDSDESKDKSETAELKVDMKEMLEESAPDEIMIVSDIRENLALEEPEEETNTKKKTSGYTKLRKSNFDDGGEVPLFDDGLFDLASRRPRNQTQKIIKVNPQDILRESTEYGVEFEANKLKKAQNKIKILVHAAKLKEVHHKVRNTYKREESKQIQEENEPSELNNFVDELSKVEAPLPKKRTQHNIDGMTEADLSPQSTRVGFMSTRMVKPSGIERQDTIGRMEEALENKNYEGNEF